MAFNCCCTHLHVPLGYWLLLHALMNNACSSQAPKTVADVIWRHRMTSSLHVNSHASTSTLALVHVSNTSLDDISSSTAWLVTQLGNPKLTRTSIHWLWTWTVDFDFCVDLWPKVKIFKRAYLAQFFAQTLISDSISSFETPKLVNWHILHCGFFKGIFQGISKWSSHAYPTSNLHQASPLSLREGVRDILNILAQCNRPKPNHAYTSSLGFNRLYILMLWHIVT